MVFWSNPQRSLPDLPGVEYTTSYHPDIVPFLEQFYSPVLEVEVEPVFIEWCYQQPHVSLIAWKQQQIVGYMLTILTNPALTLYLAVAHPKQGLAEHLIQKSMTLIGKTPVYYFGSQPRGCCLQSFGVDELPLGPLTIKFPEGLMWSWDQLASCPLVTVLEQPSGKMMLLRRSWKQETVYLLVMGEGTVTFNNREHIKIMNMKRTGYYVGYYQCSPGRYPFFG